MVSRILPSENESAAADRELARYVAAALGEPRLQAVAPLIGAGLDYLQSLARGSFGRDLPACSPEERDALLRLLDESPPAPLRAFLPHLVRLCLEGSPRGPSGCREPEA